MKPGPIDDAFFLGDAILLVEDPLTGSVLRETWSQDAKAKRIKVRAVGGRDAVYSLTQASREAGKDHVYGLVDRDFGMPLGSAPVFRTGWHEMENDLLDLEVVAKLSADSTAALIREVAHAFASTCRHWTAVRRTLVDLRRELPSFPKHPAVAEVPTLADAQRWLSQGRGGVAPDSRKMLDKWSETHLHTMLEQNDAQYADELNTDQWLETFSGKEILQHVRGAIRWKRSAIGETNDTLAFEIARQWSPPTWLTTVCDTIVRERRL